MIDLLILTVATVLGLTVCKGLEWWHLTRRGPR